MADFYDASRPAASSGDPMADIVAAGRTATEDRLLGLLSEVSARVDEMRAEDLADAQDAEDAEEDGEALDPVVLDLLDRISGADDAPVVFRSLHRRVAEGRMTWQDFWRSPGEYDGGQRLLAAVVAAQLEGHALARQWYADERARRDDV